MGHLINPTQFRLGYSLFYNRNWPALNQAQYMLCYGIQKDFYDYFRALFNLRVKLILKRKNKRRRYFTKVRHPRLLFSACNVNFFGFNLHRVLVDVNIFDLKFEAKWDSLFDNKKFQIFLFRFGKIFRTAKILRKPTFFSNIKKETIKKFFIILNLQYHKVNGTLLSQTTKWVKSYLAKIYQKFFAFFNDSAFLINKRRALRKAKQYIKKRNFKEHVFITLKYNKQKKKKFIKNWSKIFFLLSPFSVRGSIGFFQAKNKKKIAKIKKILLRKNKNLFNFSDFFDIYYKLITHKFAKKVRKRDLNKFYSLVEGPKTRDYIQSIRKDLKFSLLRLSLNKSILSLIPLEDKIRLFKVQAHYYLKYIILQKADLPVKKYLKSLPAALLDKRLKKKFYYFRPIIYKIQKKINTQFLIKNTFKKNGYYKGLKKFIQNVKLLFILMNTSTHKVKVNKVIKEFRSPDFLYPFIQLPETANNRWYKKFFRYLITELTIYDKKKNIVNKKLLKYINKYFYRKYYTFPRIALYKKFSKYERNTNFNLKTNLIKTNNFNPKMNLIKTVNLSPNITLINTDNLSPNIPLIENDNLSSNIPLIKTNNLNDKLLKQKRSLRLYFGKKRFIIKKLKIINLRRSNKKKLRLSQINIHKFTLIKKKKPQKKKKKLIINNSVKFKSKLFKRVPPINSKLKKIIKEAKIKKLNLKKKNLKNKDYSYRKYLYRNNHIKFKLNTKNFKKFKFIPFNNRNKTKLPYKPDVTLRFIQDCKYPSFYYKNLLKNWVINEGNDWMEELISSIGGCTNVHNFNEQKRYCSWLLTKRFFKKRLKKKNQNKIFKGFINSLIPFAFTKKDVIWNRVLSKQDYFKKKLYLFNNLSNVDFKEVYPELGFTTNHNKITEELIRGSVLPIPKYRKEVTKTIAPIFNPTRLYKNFDSPTILSNLDPVITERRALRDYHYTLDPFFQKYMKLNQIKSLQVNIGVDIGDQKMVTAKFLSFWLKSLFKKGKKLTYVLKTLNRFIKPCNNYISAVSVLFAGRFTRSAYTTYKYYRFGKLNSGQLFKQIDYDGIEFLTKFGMCGIKIKIQYKVNVYAHRDLATYAKTAVLGSEAIINKFNEDLHLPMLMKYGSKRLFRLNSNLKYKNNIHFYQFK